VVERHRSMPVSKFVDSLGRDPDMEEAIQVAVAEYGILFYAASFSVQGDDTQLITVGNIGAPHVQIAAENCLHVSKLYQSRWAQLCAALAWLPSNTMSATLVLLSTPEIRSDVTRSGTSTCYALKFTSLVMGRTGRSVHHHSIGTFVESIKEQLLTPRQMYPAGAWATAQSALRFSGAAAISCISILRKTWRFKTSDLQSLDAGAAPCCFYRRPSPGLPKTWKYCG